MNWDVLEPILKELLEDTKAIKKELQQRAKEGEIIRGKLEELAKKEAAREAEKKESPDKMITPDLKLFLVNEFQRLRAKIQEGTAIDRQGGDIFSSDTRARNFKLLFESVCKWAGMLIGGFYLLYTFISYLTDK